MSRFLTAQEYPAFDWTRRKLWTEQDIIAERKRINTMAWGSIVERETHARIKLAVAAYAYEIADTPVMSDAEFDQLAARIDRNIMTGHPVLDEFFLVEFSAMTGMWIHRHPELDGVKRIFERQQQGDPK